MWGITDWSLSDPKVDPWRSTPVWKTVPNGHRNRCPFFYTSLYAVATHATGAELHTNNCLGGEARISNNGLRIQWPFQPLSLRDPQKPSCALLQAGTADLTGGGWFAQRTTLYHRKSPFLTSRLPSHLQGIQTTRLRDNEVLGCKGWLLSHWIKSPREDFFSRFFKLQKRRPGHCSPVPPGFERGKIQEKGSRRGTNSQQLRLIPLKAPAHVSS